MTKAEQEALRVAKRYRRQLDRMEDDSARQLASAFVILRNGIKEDMALLREDSPDPLNFRYLRDVQPRVERRLRDYFRIADRTMESLSRKAAEMGVNATDEQARWMFPDGGWSKVSIAGIFTGKIMSSAKDSLLSLPGTITSRIQDLVGQAVGMAEQGLDWLMSQIGDTLGKAWGALQRLIRTTAERMFRQAQQEQRKQTPITYWRRVANHETACLACLMLEGHIYERQEDFSDHPNGRCFIVPCEDNTDYGQPGKKWLEEQDEETQKRIMGKGRWEAWQNGDISLDQMTELVNVPEYGMVPHVIPLRDLLP
jgi:hypothetical protein